MALKAKLTEAEWKKLSKELQEEYTAGEGDDADTYTLDVEGGEDAGALRRANMRLKEDNKKLKKAAKDAAAAGDGTEETDDDTNDEPAAKTGKKKGDVETIDRQWKKKFDKETGALSEKLSARDAFLKRQMISAAAERMAAEISIVPKLMIPAIAERLDVDFEDADEPELFVKGADGKRSEISLDKLAKEFKADKAYAAIIIGSKASGSGAPRNGPDTKPGGSGASDEKEPDLSTISGKDLAARLKANKERQEA